MPSQEEQTEEFKKKVSENFGISTEDLEPKQSSDSLEAMEEARRRIRAILNEMKQWQEEHPPKRPEGTI